MTLTEQKFKEASILILEYNYFIFTILLRVLLLLTIMNLKVKNFHNHYIT